MKTHLVLKALLSSAALALASSAALASGHAPVQLPTGAIVFKNDHGIPMLMIPDGGQMGTAYRSHVNPPGSPDGESNISRDPLAPFISWYGYFAGGGDSLAFQFTATRTGSVKQINIPLAAVDASSYGYTAEVDLYTDENGTPGSKLDGADVPAAETSFGPCCALTNVKLGFRPKLAAGTPYWVVVTPDANSDVAWQIEDTGFIYFENVGENSGAGWSISSTQWIIPAFEVK